MTLITRPTTLGTVKATTLGNHLFQNAQWGLTQQKNAVKNPSGLDYVSLTIDNEVEYDSYPEATGGSASIEISFPCGILTIPPTSDKSIVVPDYLTSSGYDAGSGGTPTFSSASWCQSLVEAILLIHLLQNKASKNPLNIKPVSNWSIASANDTGTVLNGLFTASIELPLIQSIDGTTGNLILSGASPWGDLS